METSNMVEEGDKLDISDVMVGNWLLSRYSGHPVRLSLPLIKSLDSDDINVFFKPMPVTDDVMVSYFKFNIVDDGESRKFTRTTLYSSAVVKKHAGMYLYEMINTDKVQSFKQVLYVHELQNLYKAVCGENLMQ